MIAHANYGYEQVADKDLSAVVTSLFILFCFVHVSSYEDPAQTVYSGWSVSIIFERNPFHI